MRQQLDHLRYRSSNGIALSMDLKSILLTNLISGIIRSLLTLVMEVLILSITLIFKLITVHPIGMELCRPFIMLCLVTHSKLSHM